MRPAAPHAGRLCRHPNFCRVHGGRAGLRGQPDQRLARAHSSLARGRDAAGLQHPGHRRHAQDRRDGHRAASRRCCRRRTRCERETCRPSTSRSACSAAARTAIPASAPTRRWARRSISLVAHGGTGDPVGNARDLWRRAPVHAPRGQPRGRREAGRADATGGRSTPRSNGGEMNNNPSPGNKAGGLTTILEKSLGAVAKGGTHQPGRRRTSTPSR